MNTMQAPNSWVETSKAYLATVGQWWEQRTERERVLLSAATMLASLWLALEASSWSAKQADMLADARLKQAQEIQRGQPSESGDGAALKNAVLRIRAWTVAAPTPQIASLTAVSALREALGEAAASLMKVDSWRLGKAEGQFTPIIMTVIGDYDQAAFEAVLDRLQRTDISFELVSLDVSQEPGGAKLRASFQALHSSGEAPQ